MYKHAFCAALLLARVRGAPNTLTARDIFAPPVLEAADFLLQPRTEEQQACTFSGTEGFAKLEAGKGSCSTITIDGLQVPGGKTLDLTELADGTEVIFTGETSFAYEEWSGPLVSISGSKLKVSGAKGSWLNGRGAQYWDGQGLNGGKDKPKFFAVHGVKSSSFTNLWIADPPVSVFSISGCQDVSFQDITVNGAAGDKRGAANTDAFDVGNSNGVHIDNARVWNQDDCVAVNSGSDITFSNGICANGHGLSIGSVGGRDDNEVGSVLFKDSKIGLSQNGTPLMFLFALAITNMLAGIRVKTIAGKTGKVSGITYSNILLYEITKTGIIITQSYNGDKGAPTAGIEVSNLVLEGILGTVRPDGTNIHIECGDSSCHDWHFSDVQVTGGQKSEGCKGVPEGAAC